MPWHIEKKGEKFCVVKDDSGEEVSCKHDTRESAEGHLKALYANEPDEKTTADSAVITAADNSNGIMVAVFPPPELAASLAIENGEPAEKLHVTLAYIGNTDEVEVTDELRASVTAALQEVARSHRPLEGTIGGRGEFPPGDDGTPIWIPVDVVGLDALRVDVVRALEDVGLPARTDHGFAPHMTLAYSSDEAPIEAAAVPSQPITFGSLALVIADEATDIPLGHFDAVVDGEKGDTVGGTLTRVAHAGDGGKELFIPSANGTVTHFYETIDASETARKVSDAITAHAAEAHRPPAEFFTYPGADVLKRTTTITDDGRVHFYVAMADECHIGYANRCVTLADILPGGLEYAYSGGGTVITAAGEEIRTSAVTVTNGHADLSLDAPRAKEHYDDPAHAFADVVYGLDEEGNLWASGALRPSATEEQVYMARASAVSLDAREIEGQLRFLGACCVNRPGFPKVKMRLVASAEGEPEHIGALIITGEHPDDCETCREEEWEALTASITSPPLHELEADLLA